MRNTLNFEIRPRPEIDSNSPRGHRPGSHGTWTLLAIVASVAPAIAIASEWPALDHATRGAKWAHPKLSDANFRKWIDFVRPTRTELKWQDVRWHIELADAQIEARELDRPILLWTMNGHPCGET